MRETLREHVAHAEREPEPRLRERGVVGEHAMVHAVLHVGIPETRDLAQVVGDVVRLARGGRRLHDFRELEQLLDQRDLFGEDQRRTRRRRRARRHRDALLHRLALDAVRARMGVLHVEGGVLLPVLVLGEIDVEVEVAVAPCAAP